MFRKGTTHPEWGITNAVTVITGIIKKQISVFGNGMLKLILMILHVFLIVFVFLITKRVWAPWKGFLIQKIFNNVHYIYYRKK
jgi:hypothetical protein